MHCFTRLALPVVSFTMCWLPVTVRASVGDAPQFKPALVGTNEDSVLERLRLAASRDKSSGSMVVQFNCEVNAAGKASNVAIWSGLGGSPPYVNAAKHALLAGRFEPAQVWGKPVAVSVIGTIFCIRREGAPEVRIFLNLDRRMLAEERNFVAAQLIGGCEELNIVRESVRLFAAFDMDVVAEYRINSNGLAHDVRVVREAPKGVGQLLVKSLYRARFIPAFLDGKPVESSLSEHQYSHRR